MLIDSHCHILFDEIYLQLDEYLRRCDEMGVTELVNIIIAPEELERAETIKTRYAGRIHHAFGLHPNQQPGEVGLDFEALMRYHADYNYCAVGETGLDFFRSDDAQDSSWQFQRFEAHVEAAKALDKPLIIHTRNADKETHAMLQSHAGEVGGVIHCFASDAQWARKYLDLGFHISFTGIVTFKSAHDIQQAAQIVPRDRILVETDSPYLAPVPKRGKQNEPAFTHYVADYLSALLDWDFEDLCRQTTHNTRTLFNI